MYRTDVVFNDIKRQVSFFDDDTIDVVRQQIAKTVDIHQDRLFTLIRVELSRNYYKSDSRNWEILFNRLSLNGMPIQKETFKAYCSEHRSPAANITYQKIDKEEWMSYPKFLQDLYDPGGEFLEYRIFGVDVEKSYCIPIELDQSIATRIPAAQLPLPENETIFLSLYSIGDIRGFLVKEYEPGLEGAYFPLFRSTTPARLSESQIKLLDSNSKHLTDLLSLDPPAPKAIHILKSNWKVDLVDTEFGDAEHTRFEQIFYGLTVSKTIPCITFYTGRTERSRHKFFKETAQTKTPFLDLRIWSAWWTKSRPSRDRIPTLVLYRGKDRENFDRITIVPTEIIFAIYRDDTNTKTLDELKTSLLHWFQSFDSITPFVSASDIVPCRWILQRELRISAVYSDHLDEFEKRRMNCISGLFDESRTNPTIFRMLRSDDANNDVNSRDLKILNMIRDDPFITARDVEEEMKVTTHDALQLLQAMRQRLDEQPGLLSREFRKLPIIEIKPTSVVVSYINNIDRFLKYVNILRYILSNPTSKELDRICPKRLETVGSVVVTTATVDFIDSEFSDLFGYLEDETPQDVEPEKKTVTRPTSKSGTLYSYFNERLQSFDPKSFNKTVKSNYPKKCEQSHQPVILSDEEIQNIVNDATKGSEFDPRTYPEKKKIEVENPHGIVVCPDYWCMYDKIPLQESQLVTIAGIKTCPVCQGKLRDAKHVKADIREFSLISRTKGHSYPKLKDYSTNDTKLILPCCYKTAKEIKLVKEEKEDKYYILGETKLDLTQLRLAYLPESLIHNLYLPETYSIAIQSHNHIQTGMSGFFRIGLGRPAVGIPILLNMSATVLSPKHSISCILRCSFVATWPDACDTHSAEIEHKIDDIEPFKSCQITRRHMARVISSIDVAFSKKELTLLQELEYTAIVLNIDIFRINLDTQTVGCTFYTQQMKKRTKGLIVLQRGDDIDCLCYATRTQKKFIYRTNVFEPPFVYDTYAELERRRKKACHTNEIPRFADAVEFIKSIGFQDEYSIVLDPFGRAQSLYVPGELILPFQNVPIPPFKQPKIQGYKDVKDLPTHADMLKILESAQKINAGYEWSEDMHDISGNIVEILTRSGLRIPIQSIPSTGEPGEVTHTIIKESETVLALGKQNDADVQKYKSISYASELYEFLIYQLTNDIRHDYVKLKHALLLDHNALEPLLHEWFETTTHFIHSTSPIEFLSKIRKPCGQFKSKNVCDSGHMCAWKDDKCKIQIRDSISKTKLFNKLLGTLQDNSKTRSMVLDGRTTPFFSTILYIDLPTEIILTDSEIKTELV